MKNNKVVIMSIDGRETVGYTNNGEFISVPKKKHHQVGQIIDLSEFKPTKKRHFAKWQVATAVASIMLIAMMSLFYPLFTPQAEAYLSMGLNSGGVELWVDENNKVIDVNYHDAAANWGDLKVTEKDVYEAITLLTTQAKKSGLIDDQQNLLMLNYASLKGNTALHLDEHMLRESVNNVLSVDNNYLLIMGNHDTTFVNKAKELGVTASQYYVMEKSSSKGHHLSTDQIMHHNIKDVLNQNGTTPEEIFGMERHTDQAESQMPTAHDSKSEHTSPMMPDTNIQEQNHQSPSSHSDGTMPQKTTSTVEGPQEVETHDSFYSNKETMHQEKKGEHN